MIQVLRALSLSLTLSAALLAQGVSSISGTAKDPTGAIVPAAAITLVNVDTGAQRSDVSDNQGRYSFTQVQPGNYRITAKSVGLRDITVNDIRLLVNTPATLDLTFERVGDVVTSVSVSAEVAQVNTVDATIGNAVGDKAITQLPFEGRNVVGLLAVQPGVIYIGEPGDPSKLNDYRSGAVNGGKSDQANVTLDGVDVNDSVNGAAFKSVLRVTLDSVQEFRTITSNAGAEMGRSSGAQVSLITKTGTNTIHGSAYEYLRNTDTSANTFFNNAAGVPRAKLNRNVFGASAGGPIKQNRAFFFLNYEGRRDASESTALRTVPNATFRNGAFTYVNKAGSNSNIGAAQLKALDPQGIGVSQAALADFQKYPLPNDNSVGDGLNTAGFRFNASTPLRWNTYIARFDYTLDTAGKHQIFWRGNLQNDNFANGIPQFPGQPASTVYLENSKGYGVGYTAILKPTVVSNFRYGFTRQGVEKTGILSAPYAYFTGIDPLYALTQGNATIAPVHTFSEDIAWNKGAHAISFGGVIRLTDNKTSGPGSFSNALAKSVWYFNDGTDLLPGDAKPSTVGENEILNIFGILSQLTTNQQYDKTGAKLSPTTLINRDWRQRSYELYAQDSWKFRPNLTATVGLRYGANPPVFEANGFQVSPTTPLNDLFNQRNALAASGQSQTLAPRVSYDLFGKPGTRSLYPYHNTWSPRVALAWSPGASSGLAKILFGGAGKTSIRAGWGMYYDNFGQALAANFSTRQLGLSTSLRNASGQPATNLPRYNGFYSVPLETFPPTPAGGFPQTTPDGGQNTSAIDDQLLTPYVMSSNISIGREFKGGFFVQVAYVNRAARRSLVGQDVIPPTNLVDPKSGQTYYQAAQILAAQALAGVPQANIAPVPFWENLWPGAAANGRTATQNVYPQFVNTHGDYTTALRNLDVNCTPACSKLGPFAQWSPQYVDLYAYRSVGAGNYNGMEWTVRKRFTQGYQFDFNFTWSKAEDLASNRETAGSLAQTASIVNPLNKSQNKAVSDYDATRVASALAVIELPFGKGKKFLSNANPVVNGALGGWQISTIFRNTSGFVKGVANGVGYPTNWAFNGWATETGASPDQSTTKNAPAATASGKGGANIFSNPAAAFAAYSPTLPGFVGQRNGIRGDGAFGLDLSLGKRFNLFKVHDQQHSLQVRAEGFNITNSVRFDINNANLDIANQAKFGQYTQVLTQPRVFQFSMRYEF
jgi:hypothetical protein